MIAAAHVEARRQAIRSRLDALTAERDRLTAELTQLDSGIVARPDISLPEQPSRLDEALTYLRSVPRGASAAHLQVALRISRTNAYQVVRRLKDRGLVIKRGGLWVISCPSEVAP